MSIWASVGADVRAADMHTQAAVHHTTRGSDLVIVGPDLITVDVATATSWTKRIRLGAYGDHFDVCLSLSRVAAITLRANLDQAIALTGD